MIQWYVYIHLFFFRFFSHYRLLQNIALCYTVGSLCYTVDPYWLSILYTAVNIILLPKPTFSAFLSGLFTFKVTIIFCLHLLISYLLSITFYLFSSLLTCTSVLRNLDICWRDICDIKALQVTSYQEQYYNCDCIININTIFF